MILYLGIIAVSMVLIFAFNAGLGSVCYVERGLWGLALVIVVAVVVVFVIDMLVSAIVSVLPPKMFGVFERVYKWERHFYEKIGVRKWKDYVPIGKGPLFLGMNKSKIADRCDIGYLLKLKKECFRAEVMHFLSIFVGFLIIVFLPLEYLWVISLPVAIVNAFLQTLPFIIQRYNLPKLDILIKRAERNARKEAVQEKSSQA